MSVCSNLSMSRWENDQPHFNLCKTNKKQTKNCIIYFMYIYIYICCMYVYYFVFILLSVINLLVILLILVIKVNIPVV